MMNHTVFRLKFSISSDYACFPFIFEGGVVPGVSAILSSRFAGNMAYSEGTNSPARLALFRSLNLNPGDVYACTQVHSRDVYEVGRETPNIHPRADGLISRERGVTLLVTVADCLPVFLYDTGGGSAAGRGNGGLALVHSGFRGTGIALNALRLMEERWRTRPEDVAAILGPCIRGCCYRVDEARARAFNAEFGGVAGVFPAGPVVSEAGGGFFLDLQAANVHLLAGAGVRNIAVCEDCTFTDERLGSFRREGALGYTRMAALAGFFDIDETASLKSAAPQG
ncbi:MAG: polyphenol oxidase family protein [Spirochaetaceae bacterium]|jgi:YfiH family protein|nr:polyphenol oxidase family protein [Spirochaetaceae bacterium]